MAHRSFGTSTRTGPPRPERRRWKARRITFGSSLADVTGSADLVMFFMESGGEEVAVDPGHALGVAHGHHEDRHGLAVGLGDAAVGVLGAGAVLHHEHADLLAGGDAGDGVRHVQADALLAHDDRADAGGGAVLQDVVHGIADDPLHAFALQDFCNRIAGFHGSSAFAIRRLVQLFHPSLCRGPVSVEGWIRVLVSYAMVVPSLDGHMRGRTQREG